MDVFYSEYQKKILLGFNVIVHKYERLPLKKKKSYSFRLLKTKILHKKCWYYDYDFVIWYYVSITFYSLLMNLIFLLVLSSHSAVLVCTLFTVVLKGFGGRSWPRHDSKLKFHTVNTGRSKYAVHLESRIITRDRKRKYQ